MSDAHMQVIYDSGRAIPAAPYLPYPGSNDPDSKDGAMAGLRFPIRTRLHCGVLPRARQVFDAQWLTQPVFLVGADADSLRWLQFNRPRLLRTRAYGLVVQARDSEDFQAIQSAVPDSKLGPSPSAWLDQHLIAAGVAVYPLLIGLDGIARQIVAEGSP